MIRNEDGVKEKKQKRLLLGNLKEIYAAYKDSMGKRQLVFQLLLLRDQGIYFARSQWNAHGMRLRTPPER